MAKKKKSGLKISVKQADESRDEVFDLLTNWKKTIDQSSNPAGCKHKFNKLMTKIKTLQPSGFNYKNLSIACSDVNLIKESKSIHRVN